MFNIEIKGINELQAKLGKRPIDRVVQNAVHEAGDIALKRIQTATKKKSRPGRPRTGNLSKSWRLKKKKMYAEVYSTQETSVLKWVEYGTTGPIVSKRILSQRTKYVRNYDLPGDDPAAVVRATITKRAKLFLPLTRRALIGKRKAGTGNRVPGLRYGVDYVLVDSVKGQRAQGLVAKVRARTNRTFIRILTRKFDGLFNRFL